jgi:hypothetical protein
MGRLVLIEFDDNEMAEAFLKASDLPQLFEFNVVGVFIKPASLCECSPRSEDSFRGAKFGLWACPNCRKVKSNSGQYLSDLRLKDIRPIRRDVWVSVAFKMEDGKVRVITQDRYGDKWKD